MNKKLRRREAAMRDLGLHDDEIAAILDKQSALTYDRKRETKTKAQATKTKTAKAGNVRKGKGSGRRKS